MASIVELLQQAAGRVPRNDARILLAHATGLSKEFFIMHPGHVVDGKTCARFLEGIARAEQGCPIAYITGVRSFWGRDFAVTPDVLIPRPDTETLVELALELAGGARNVLDLGCGSGCIAVSLALEMPRAQVLACDVSAAALDVARANARRLGADNVRFASGDWFGAVADGHFDLIVSNPPYIEPGDPHLAALAFEPNAALTDGADGLAHLRRIIAGAPGFLTGSGILMVEHGWQQGSAVRDLFASAGFTHPSTVRDLGGNDRVTWARMPSRSTDTAAHGAS